MILDIALEKESVTLQEIKEIFEQKESKELSVLIPSIDIFKEIMVELIKAKEISINALRKEKSEYITEQTFDFQLNEMILKLIEQDEKRQKIMKIYIARTKKQQAVEFSPILDDSGKEKKIRCSNVQIMVEI